MTRAKVAIGVGAAIAALWLYRTKQSGQPVPSVTTSEGFDLSPYGGPTVYPGSIKLLGDAIARAEGFYVRGSIPQRANNPGDLKIPNWPGATLGAGIAVFDTVDAGWNALYKQLYSILVGGSSHYTLDDTIATMAATWTGNDQPTSWARNVSGALGVDVNTPLWSVLS